jgi:hypothetical protein
MRCRRLVAPVLLGVSLVLLTGCSDSTSPAQRAWERSASLTRPANQSEPTGALVAGDGLGHTIFTPDTSTDRTHGRSTFATVPTE